MRGILVVLVVTGCTVGDVPSELRVEPAALDLTVELDAAMPATFRVMSGPADVTAEAAYTLTGAPLGTVAADGFHSNGRTGGQATVTVTLGNATGTLPIHVTLHSSRNTAAADVPTWFEAAAPTVADNDLEPGDGAVLAPNLAGLDVAIDPPAGDDLHDVELVGPDLDVHVYGSGGEATLTAAEWDAVARTSRGNTVELIARSLASADPTTSHIVSAHLAVADLPLTSEVVFAGGRAGDAGAQVWSYDPTRGRTQAWATGTAAAGLGSDLASSRDSRRIAAGGTLAPGASPVGGGAVLDVASRTAVTPPDPQIGTWTDAAFQPDGSLVTANAGVLTLRSADTALPVANLSLDVLAAQPTVAHDGHALAYVTGPMDSVTDPASPQPTPLELRVHDWNPATQTLGAPVVIAPASDGTFVKYPDFSPDDRFVVYTSAPAAGAAGDIVVARADGSEAPIVLASGYDMARFASPIIAARTGYTDAEPVVWIVMQSDRAVAGRDQTGVPQLYAMAFYPELGLASRPFYLPGQDPTIAVRHAPAILAH